MPVMSLGSTAMIEFVEGYSGIEMKDDRHFNNVEFTFYEGKGPYRNEIRICLDAEEIKQLSEMILEAASWLGVY